MFEFNIPNLNLVPHLNQFFGDWAIQEEAFTAFSDIASKIEITSHLESQAAERARNAKPSDYRSQSGNAAVIRISGMMMKQASSFGGGTSTVMVRQAIRDAAKDDSIDSIVLHIDSPGGTVAGTGELAAEISEADKKKPVVAYIEDLGASAAYWAASQAREIYSNEAALVGSIGTYGVVYDLSMAAASQGVKVHVVRAGEFKGAGTPGTQITDRQLAMIQERIDGLNELFLAGVSSGRKMSMERVKEIADGAAHIASKAKTLGLIDGISTFENTISRALSLAGVRTNGRTVVAADVLSSSNERVGHMSQTIDAASPQPATIAQIENECVGASAEFVLAQAKNNVTIEQAKSAWIKEQASVREKEAAAYKAEIEAKNKEIEELKAAKASAPKSGVKAVPVATATVVGGSAKERWNDAVKAEQSKGLSKEQALLAADKNNPGLRQEMIDEHNASRS